MLSPGETVLAACSGGCDSMALTHILYCLKDQLGFNLAAVNIDHMLRLEAKDEARLVEEFCFFLRIPYYHQAVDVPDFMEKNGLSLQEAARIKRYEYLRSISKKIGGAKIAIGHHLDDQAETVLINLLRGSGSGGLGGMKVFTGEIIRPLLSVSRETLESYCAENKIPFCHDTSNFKTDYLRNAIRLNLIPQLEKEYNNNIKETLVKTAEIAAAEDDFIEEAALLSWKHTVDSNDNRDLRLNIEQFSKLHLAVKRKLIRKIIEKKLGKLTGISFVHVESLIQLAEDGRVGSILTLPHALIVEKTYDSLIFTETFDTFSKADACAENSAFVSQTLTIDAMVQIPELNLIVSLKLHSACSDVTLNNASSFTAIFDYELLKPPFLLRTRLPGDRFTPNGSSGGKKLKEFFIDKKIPQKQRDFVPLILDQEGIIWVAGYRRANRAQVTAATQKILQFELLTSEECECDK